MSVVGFSSVNENGKHNVLINTTSQLQKKAKSSDLKELRISKGMSVIELSQLSGLKVEKLKAILSDVLDGVVLEDTSAVPLEAAELIAFELGFTPKIVTKRKFATIKRTELSKEQRAGHDMRPAVVTIMGHVDHGKTTLLDAIRGSAIAASEAGGITQRITAFNVQIPQTGESCTFIDTPGHAAFTRMRSRGARITDIVILVVSAVEGIKPQTVEAIQHIQSFKVPLVVAINKCDLHAADPNKVRAELLQYNIISEELGGDVPTIQISAKTKAGLTELLEAVSFLAMEIEPRADPSGAGEGCVLEAGVDPQVGMVMTALVMSGSLRVGDAFVAGAAYGHVRSLAVDNKSRDTILPGMPVVVCGLRTLPAAGDDFIVVESEARAREISRQRVEQKTQRRINHQAAIAKAVAERNCREQCVVIKGDSVGSVEAIVDSIERVPLDEVAMRVVKHGVGPVTEADIMVLGEVQNPLIYAFNVKTPSSLSSIAQMTGVEIKSFDIIYSLLDHVHETLSALLPPEKITTSVGKGVVQEVFVVTGRRQRHDKHYVAGTRIMEGHFRRPDLYRVTRAGAVVFEGRLESLRQFKESVNKVESGNECGLVFNGFADPLAGDVVEAIEITQKPRKLPDNVFDMQPTFGDDGVSIGTASQTNDGNDWA
eukprot:c18143_g1_i1.p1 GENE.c18143_g1_i1~~c18143_g1_i1.p1  ORF type:complete len:759 (-),score=233.63 c18143_g1_i1:156-2120(-)